MFWLGLLIGIIIGRCIYIYLYKKSKKSIAKPDTEEVWHTEGEGDGEAIFFPEVTAEQYDQYQIEQTDGWNIVKRLRKAMKAFKE